MGKGSTMRRFEAMGTLAVMVALAGCQTFQVAPGMDGSSVELAQLQARAERNAALIKEVDQPEWTSGRLLSVTADVIAWNDELGRRMSVHVRELEAIRFRRRRAALIGWTTLGISAGALLGQATTDADRQWFDDGNVWAGAAAGGAAGVALGLWIGLPVTYRFVGY